MEDSEVGHSKLLVARYNKGSEAVCGRIQHLPVKQKLYRATS